MSGMWAISHGDTHTCDLPDKSTARPGAIWLCDCGSVWSLMYVYRLYISRFKTGRSCRDIFNEADEVPHTDWHRSFQPRGETVIIKSNGRKL